MTNQVKPFIEANTIPLSYSELEAEHIIPVFTRNNQPLISQAQFIGLTKQVTEDFFGASISDPEIRVSHPIQGRIPSAKHKKADQLEPHEKTLYYQRNMFIFRISGMGKQVNGQDLSLIVGGVKAYNLDNINGYRESLQQFKIFIGFQVSVCANLCVWTDGAKLDLKVSKLEHLVDHFNQLFDQFDSQRQIDSLLRLQEYTINESQFAHLIGRCRLFPHMPTSKRKGIPQLSLGDSQVTKAARGFYQDPEFRNEGGEIDLWSLYNLFTDANKSSYLDTAVDKTVDAMDFVLKLKEAVEGDSEFWYLE